MQHKNVTDRTQAFASMSRTARILKGDRTVKKRLAHIWKDWPTIEGTYTGVDVYSENRLNESKKNQSHPGSGAT